MSIRTIGGVKEIIREVGTRSAQNTHRRGGSFRHPNPTSGSSPSVRRLRKGAQLGCGPGNPGTGRLHLLQWPNCVSLT